MITFVSKKSCDLIVSMNENVIFYSESYSVIGNDLNSIKWLKDFKFRVYKSAI